MNSAQGEESGKPITPMMRQYMAAKSAHPDALLLFRMGDFYELFFDDAKIAAKALDLTLTSRDRDKGDDAVPMAGVPHHAIDSYIAKLISQGFKLAMCDQMEDPKQAKGIVRREVTKVITPAMIVDPSNLNAAEPNYLAACLLLPAHDSSTPGAALGLLDLLTGEFRLTQAASIASVLDELGRTRPKELLITTEGPQPFAPHLQQLAITTTITSRPPILFFSS